MPEFEVFKRRMAPLTRTPTVTITKRGGMSLNAAAYGLLGAPPAVNLMFDRTAKIIGIAAATDGDDDAFPVNKSRDTGPFFISGTSFLKYYQIDTSESRRLSVYLDERVLCAPLAPPANATERRRANQGAPQA